METVPAVVLVIGVAIAWLGITAFVIVRFRRRRSGSSLVRSAPASGELAGKRRGRTPRRVRVVAGDSTVTSARRLSLRVRKVRR
ncbi:MULTISPECIES: hypothetical protein [Pseudarthrobacter]|jgi:hypothetical protein|uniref:hypothetical protein n=1 Tax=Pseudarthrobacter TaxID=1742993 RepID=UPI0013DD4FB7|nr:MULTISPECIES: hypothetical protein [Pseudarthrobacter]MDP9996777.1 hypothetical protein [Pseudarthrobacter sulfonivorans]